LRTHRLQQNARARILLIDMDDNASGIKRTNQIVIRVLWFASVRLHPGRNVTFRYFRWRGRDLLLLWTLRLTYTEPRPGIAGTSTIEAWKLWNTTKPAIPGL
jgi:hypothetical protein